MDPVHDRGSMDPVHKSGPWTRSKVGVHGPCMVPVLSSPVGSKSVALYFGFYGAQVRLHMNF